MVIDYITHFEFQEERQRTKERDPNIEVEPTSSSNTDMPVELILRAENKADAIKTEQQYIEQQVRFLWKKKQSVNNATIY